jgi:iron(II)-dependent oxidoreductase
LSDDDGGSTVSDLLSAWIIDARARTFDLVADLSDAQLMGPRLAIINPLLWEIGHVAWFQEYWALRTARGEAPIRADGDALYNSSEIPHDVRWDLPLPSRTETIAYLERVRNAVLDRLDHKPPTERERYFAMLSIFHEDMHDEAFMYTRQTLEYRAPELEISRDQSTRKDLGGALTGDARVPGGTFWLGTSPAEPFVFDNEKWAHPVSVKPFSIARAALSQSEFRDFVEDGGYRRPEMWCEDGRRWLDVHHPEHPVYWRKQGREWFRRDFDRWVLLEPHKPVLHVSWYEADAYCRWAKRRLPTEIEWEVAAAGEPDATGRALSPRKRRFPWGDDPPTPERANLDGHALGAVDVGARGAGDSAFGVRQMMGNVWEWTSDDFVPYPGFMADPYKDYSEPWFGDHKVLRGGCWTTRSRLLRNTWRNFYKPNRRDVWAGFRTCRME